MMTSMESNLHSRTKNGQFGPKMVKLEAFKNHDYPTTRKRVFLFISAHFFPLLSIVNKLALLPDREGNTTL